MKTLLIITAIVFLYSTTFLKAQGIYITSKYSDCDDKHSSETEAGVFEQWVEGALFKEFPCATVLSATDEKTLIQYNRQLSLLGNNEAADQIMEGLGTDRTFVVQLTVARYKTYFMFKALCIGSKLKESISYDVRQLPVDYSDTEIMNLIYSMRDKLVKNLSYAEPCAYKGEINLISNEVSESKDSTNSLTKCDGYIGSKMRVDKSKTETNAEWKFNKISRIAATGTVKWHIVSAGNKVDSTDCYLCKSGKLAYRRSELITESEFNGSGVPKDVKVEGKEYFRISTILTFKEDSTFFIALHGSAGFAEGDVKTREKINGCDKTDLTNLTKAYKSVDLSVTLGPFKGSPMDKELHAEGVMERKNSISTSGTFRYNFTLRRK